MFLLLAEHVNLFFLLRDAAAGSSFFSEFMKEFFHHEWHGMYFWDLIQPYFTFIVGVAMVFSLKKRWEKGATWFETFRHILFRCIILFLLGIVLQSAGRGMIVWELWNILTALSVSILITFMIFRLPHSAKFIFSLCLLLMTELLYQYFPIDGFDQPFTKHHNFGAYIDTILIGKIHPDGWVAFNFIPATAHMIWGVLSGSLLIDTRNESQKIKILILWGLAGVLAGYGIDIAGVSPINKHICTISFMIVSGGWCLVTLAVFYWLIDIKGYKRWTLFFAVMGMNSIFIYVFSHALGRKGFYPLVAIFTDSLFSMIGLSEGYSTLGTSMVILFLEWYICFWLYKKKIFIKI